MKEDRTMEDVFFLTPKQDERMPRKTHEKFIPTTEAKRGKFSKSNHKFYDFDLEL